MFLPPGESAITCTLHALLLSLYLEVLTAGLDACPPTPEPQRSPVIASHISRVISVGDCSVSDLENT